MKACCIGCAKAFMKAGNVFRFVKVARVYVRARVGVGGKSAKLADLGVSKALTLSNPQSTADLNMRNSSTVTNLNAIKENRMNCGFEHEKSAFFADLNSWIERKTTGNLLRPLCPTS